MGRGEGAGLRRWDSDGSWRLLSVMLREFAGYHRRIYIRWVVDWPIDSWVTMRRTEAPDGVSRGAECIVSVPDSV